MPVVLPPGAGYLGKSRRRISASGLVTWERCPRQWHYRRRIGISDATVPEMIIGLVVEDALCGLYMERFLTTEAMPSIATWVNFSRQENGLALIKSEQSVMISDMASIRAWAESIIPTMVTEVQRILKERWDKNPWKANGRDIAEVEDIRIENLLRGGIQLQLEEVENCFNANGGPHLEAYRASGDPFTVPAPCWDEEPVKPGMSSSRTAATDFNQTGEITAWEAWEIARPWVKDPRIAAPQRLFHPEGWAAGEMDLVHRWDGSVRICDIKASAGTSGYSAGLANQLRFYQWLWSITRTHSGRPEGGESGGELSGLEGWYLMGPHRKIIDLMDEETLASESERWKNIHSQMTLSGLHPTHLAPADPAPWVNHAPGGKALPVEDEVAAKALTCKRCTAVAFCDDAPKAEQAKALAALTPLELGSPENLIQYMVPKPPCTMISQIPQRLNVKGEVKGHWGPLSNHYGEEVRGAAIAVGSTNVVIEEMGADSFGEIPQGTELALLDVAPGLWRRMTRLYLDEHSEIKPVDETGDVEFTRLGLIPTKANLSGQIVSRGGHSGVNVRGKPWSMSTCHLWDGESIVEVVAFGSAITRTFQKLQVGDFVRILAAELGWRDGVPQVRIDQRQTRLEIKEPK
jgi:hypothetical protein